MSDHDKSGSAFPRYGNDAWSKPSTQAAGLTVRQYYASQALAGICAHSDTWGLATAKKIATAAFEIADAMIEAEASAPIQPTREE